LEIFNYAFR